MKKSDINQYGLKPVPDPKGNSTGKAAGKAISRVVITIVSLFFATLFIIGIFMFSYIMSLRGEEIDIDLHSLNLDYTSFIYVNDESGNPVEYNGHIGVFLNDETQPYKEVNVSLSALPTEDQELLKKGITANSQGEVQIILEDYIS